MQDNEDRCDDVNFDNLTYWVSAAKKPALVKVQSVYAPWRRHFMNALGVEDGAVTCLEPSDRSGVLKTRLIKQEQILGIRYLEQVQNSIQTNPSTNQSLSPFSR